MIIEYVTIKNTYQLDFDREINNRLRMGWELYGLQSSHVQPNGMIYVQVMVKTQEDVVQYLEVTQ
jgi:hypothetical protein